MIGSLELLPGLIEIENNIAEKHIWSFLKTYFANETGFLGYRVLPLGNKKISDTPSFSIITENYGVIFIDVVSDKVVKIEDENYWKLENGKIIYSRDALVEYFEDEAQRRTKQSNELYSRKKKLHLFNSNKAILFYSNSSEELKKNEEYFVCDIIGNDNLEYELTKKLDSYKSDALDKLKSDKIFSVLEGTSSYESSKILEKECITVNDFIQKSLNLTFKQDRSQRQISLQLPNGPQRIRGLAGTGKTVVLSLKSALTHFQYKDFKILYLFNTQSLYNQIEKLIENYYIPEAKATPNKNNLEILHAWGGYSKPGLYFNLCKKYGLSPLTFNDVRGKGDSLYLIYHHLLRNIGKKLEEEYDIVLIDEAQDFPQPLFEVVYKITKKPKRIIWAYDEFQSLKDIKIKEPEELFGFNDDGIPNIKNDDLKGLYEGGIRKDFILPNCYRNPRSILMVAHAIALGLYCKDGLVDSIDSVSDWNSLGYDVILPENKQIIQQGDYVEILRPDEHSQNSLEKFLLEQKKNPRNLMRCETLKDEIEQANIVTNEVKRLICDEQVSPEEIIIITLDTKNAENTLGKIRSLLNAKGIQSITPGIVEKSSMFKENGFVTLTTPFRAKGNEGNVVFVINCQRVYEEYNFRGRNTFFVAVTRSRGWCHLFGFGKSMKELENEVSSIRENIPKFKYTRDDDETIRRRRVILSKSDKELEETTAVIDKLIENDPELLIEQLKLKGVI